MRPVSTSSLVEQVRDQMQDAITNGTFQPGDRIVESDVAATLGVSRGPVREAARLLEQKGLVVSIPRRGFFVREFSRTQIEDLYELREWIQVAAVRCAVDRATDTDLARAAAQAPGAGESGGTSRSTRSWSRVSSTTIACSARCRATRD